MSGIINFKQRIFAWRFNCVLYQKPAGNRLGNSEAYFNKELIKTQILPEQSIGLLKARF